MVKCVGTGPGGASGLSASEVLQYVDLSADAPRIALDAVRVRVSMRVNRVTGNASTDTRFGIYLEARSGTIASGSVLGFQEVTLDSDWGSSPHGS